MNEWRAEERTKNAYHAFSRDPAKTFKILEGIVLANDLNENVAENRSARNEILKRPTLIAQQNQK